MNFILTLFLLAIPVLSHSQERIIKAHILDSQTKQPVKAASITKAGSTDRVMSDSKGQFTIPITESDKLIIAHISYTTSEIPLPEQDAFSVLVERKYVKLNPLNLDTFLSDSPRFSILEKEGINIQPNFARYNGGWQEFYTDLGEKILSTSKFRDVDSAFRVKVQFAIAESGKLEVISVEENPIIEKVFLKQSLLGLDEWIPASQNNINVPQFFQLNIIKNEEIFAMVEDPPSPIGGMKSFYQYVQKNLQYPHRARTLGIEGKVFVQFVVDEKGKLTEVQAVKGIGGGCDEEVVRLIKECPDWIPGYQDGVPVKVRMIIPITFELDSNSSIGQVPLHSFLRVRVRYPLAARKSGVEGTLYAIFEIDRSSKKIVNIEILNDIGADCGTEVKRVLNDFKILRFDELKPNMKYILPVTFGLEDLPEHRKQIELPEGKLLDEVAVIARGVDRSLRNSDGNFVPKRNPQFLSVEEAVVSNKSILKLSLVNRKLKELSPQIKELKSLVFLDLENNNLSSLPREITQLKKLEELYIPNNQLTNLPENFSNLTSLEIIGLAQNRLDKFPKQLLTLKNLEVLDLGGNNITVIPSEIYAMKNLKLLVLSDNKIKELPSEIYQLKKLEKLYLSGTLITKEKAKEIQSRLKKAEVILD
ncbi:TonB family protein [Fulvivirgaceae bacterium BMA10]|uniref:TonB family protein n=1 Tax=Splendidivirga corallicola TaxID=3051826 RepID=A0ABT8KI45_9BACT|nr:TonB family protein [Fulvivirgaceae bacterium BMA10]